MYVCICNAVTEKHIAQAVDGGCRTMRDLRQELGVGACCGRCAGCARGVLQQALDEDATPNYATGGFALGTA